MVSSTDNWSSRWLNPLDGRIDTVGWDCLCIFPVILVNHVTHIFALITVMLHILYFIFLTSYDLDILVPSPGKYLQ